MDHHNPDSKIPMHRFDPLPTNPSKCYHCAFFASASIHMTHVRFGEAPDPTPETMLAKVHAHLEEATGIKHSDTDKLVSVLVTDANIARKERDEARVEVDTYVRAADRAIARAEKAEAEIARLRSFVVLCAKEIRLPSDTLRDAREALAAPADSPAKVPTVCVGISCKIPNCTCACHKSTP